MYSYGIPVVANVNLRVELVGWFEVGYGVQSEFTETMKSEVLLQH